MPFYPVRTRLASIKWLLIAVMFIGVVAWSWFLSDFASFFWFIKERLFEVSGYALLVVVTMLSAFWLLERSIEINVKVNRRLEELHEITREAHGAAGEAALLELATTHVRGVFEFGKAAFYRREPSGDFVLLRSFGFERPLKERFGEIKQGPWRDSLARGSPAVLENRGEAAFEREVRLTGQAEEGPAEYALVPIFRENKLAGLLYAEKVGDDPTSDEELGLLAAYMDQVAVALDRMDLLRKEKTLSEELQNKVAKAVDKINRQKDFLDRVLDSVGDVIMTVERSEAGGLKIKSHNRAAQALMGARPAAGDLPIREILGANAHELIAQVLEDGKPRTDRFDVNSDGGSRMRFLGVCALLAGNPKDASPVAVLVARDESREKELEEKLQLSEMLAALGEMAASLTHELKNPLGGLDMYARLLQRDLADAPRDRRDLADKVVDGVRSLNSVVNNLLGYARVARGEMRDNVRISQVILAAADFARPEMERVGVKYTMEELEPIEVHGNFDQLRQVFLNLLLNAVQAMSETGGNLAVRILSKHKDNRRWAVVEVADTGVGMTSEQKARVFEDFYTTREKGTGLGLAISRKIIAVHGGQVTFESEWKKGTTFRVYLPLDAAPAENSKGKKAK